MSAQLISPQVTYERLIGVATDSRRRRSLDALHETCRLLHERHSSDFSYKTIVTLGKDRGLPVPGEKSIANGTGAHYRELIQAWKLISVPGRSSAKTATSNWIESIKDPAIRMGVAMLEGELRAMKAKESRKSQQTGAPIIIESLGGQVLSPNLRLNEAELAALKAAVDPETLRLSGLLIGSRGEVVDAAGRKIHKPGFRDAIEKVLSLQLG